MNCVISDINAIMGLLSFVTYNSTGFGPGKPEYVSDLLDKYDFVFLQEHWGSESVSSIG